MCVRKYMFGKTAEIACDLTFDIWIAQKRCSVVARGCFYKEYVLKNNIFYF